jgi:hypothetical protein
MSNCVSDGSGGSSDGGGKGHGDSKQGETTEKTFNVVWCMIKSVNSFNLMFILAG